MIRSNLNISSSSYQNFLNSKELDPTTFLTTVAKDGLLGPEPSLGFILKWENSASRFYEREITKIQDHADALMHSIEYDIETLRQAKEPAHDINQKYQLGDTSPKEACALLQAKIFNLQIRKYDDLLQMHKKEQGSYLSLSLTFFISLVVRKILSGLIAAGIIFAAPFALALVSPFPFAALGLTLAVIIILPIVAVVSVLSTMTATAIAIYKAVHAGRNISKCQEKLKELTGLSEHHVPDRPLLTSVSDVSKKPAIVKDA